MNYFILKAELFPAFQYKSFFQLWEIEPWGWKNTKLHCDKSGVVCSMTAYILPHTKSV